MKTKQEIVENWLPRYTGTPLKDFGAYIILVNFSHYVDLFAKRMQAKQEPLGVNSHWRFLPHE